MLLTISTTHRPATDLGGLLHHDVDGIGVAALPFGRATVCYSQADEARCTAAVMLDALHPGPAQMGMALAQVFGRTLHGTGTGTATGTAGARPALADRPLPFEVALPALASRGGPALVRCLFEPLGYRVTIDPVPVLPSWPHDHESTEMAVHLAAHVRIAGLLSHLCLLLPVLDESYTVEGDGAALDWLLAEVDDKLGDHPALPRLARRESHDHRGTRRPACSRTA